MRVSRTIKRVALRTGLYRPARLLHRRLFTYERLAFQAGLSLYGQFIRKGDLCFDIGANIGDKTEIFLALGASVVSVEPQPELAQEVKARGAHYGRNSIVVERAIGEKEGTAALHLKEHSAWASLLSDWEGNNIGEIEVGVTTLDRLIKQYGVPEFIKIDVEGYELNILRGLSYRIPFITIEYHSDQRSIAATRECISRLSSFGPVEINVIAENNHDLVLPCWLEGQEFLNQFPNCVAQHSVGDLLIKAKNYAASHVFK